MALTNAQIAIVSDGHRFRVVRCGRKFGKTEAAIEEMAGCAVSKDDCRVGYVASTFGEAKDIAWERLKKKTKTFQDSAPNETLLNLNVVTQEGGVSEIKLKGWESIETWRGTEFDLLVLDEIQNYKKFWMLWTEVLRPTLIPRRGRAIFLFTTKGFNHCFDLANMELSDTDFKSFHFTTYDNPYIPLEEIEKMKVEMTPERFSQEVMAEFTKTEGLVYKEFSREKTLYNYDINGLTETIGCIDWGFNNPAAVLSIGIKDGHFYVSDEMYKTGLTESKVAEYTAAKGYSKVYPDPENASGIEELRQRHVNVREVIKGKGSIVSGIDKVREALQSGRLHVHTSCLNLISEFESYVYPDERKERNESELPVDDNNHALDALRYAIMMYQPTKTHVSMPFYDKTSDIWANK